MRWRGATVVWAAVLAVASSSCTVTLARPGTTVACGPLHIAINPHGVALGEEQRGAVAGAVGEFGALVGRRVIVEDDTRRVAGDHVAGDPLLIEFAWPGDAPSRLGFAHPLVVDGSYAEGWMLLHPAVARAPTGIVRRLVLHELGHLYGLDHVEDPGELMNPDLTTDDYGPGDLVGLFATHAGGCASDAELPGRLLAAVGVPPD